MTTQKTTKFRGNQNQDQEQDDYGDESRDELESVIDNNYNQMLMNEFSTLDKKGGKRKGKKKGNKANNKSNQNLAQQFNLPNIFNGNFGQYMEQKIKANMPGTDLNR